MRTLILTILLLASASLYSQVQQLDSIDAAYRYKRNMVYKGLAVTAVGHGVLSATFFASSPVARDDHAYLFLTSSLLTIDLIMVSELVGLRGRWRRDRSRVLSEF